MLLQTINDVTSRETLSMCNIVVCKCSTYISALFTTVFVLYNLRFNNILLPETLFSSRCKAINMTGIYYAPSELLHPNWSCFCCRNGTMDMRPNFKNGFWFPYVMYMPKLFIYLDTWSGFEAAKTAPWPSRGLHRCDEFLEPSDE